jgi:DNA-binding NarL/FixJ family response regulator
MSNSRYLGWVGRFVVAAVARYLEPLRFSWSASNSAEAVLGLRVLIVDDNDMVRAALCELLQGQPDIEVTCEASNGSDAVRLAREHKPDLVLVDIAMPVMNGFDAIRFIKHAAPKTELLIVSQFDSPAFLRQAAAMGAIGYVKKHEAAKTLISEIRKIQQRISAGGPREAAYSNQPDGRGPDAGAR